MGKTLRRANVAHPEEYTEPKPLPKYKEVKREELVRLCNLYEWEARDKLGIPNGRPVPRGYEHPFREFLEKFPDQQIFTVENDSGWG